MTRSARLYILDTNAVSDRIDQREPLTQQLTAMLRQGNRVLLCQPVYYEVERGLLKKGAAAKQRYLDRLLVPALEWVELRNDDWRLAAAYWSATTQRGLQLSDVDLLIGAVATRYQAILVSDDNDFNALPVPRENWRKP